MIDGLSLIKGTINKHLSCLTYVGYNRLFFTLLLFAFLIFSKFVLSSLKFEVFTMIEDLEMVIDMAAEQMEAAINHLEKELSHLRAGKASPRMLDSVMVDYYGTMTPLAQTASITTPDAKTIVVQPWEKGMIPKIEKAILTSNLGFNPDNNGEIIRIFIPPLTEERRRGLQKDVSKEGEQAKISIRSARKDANDHIKKLQKDGLPEDMEKDGYDRVQKLTDDYNKKVDEMVDKKNKEIITV